MSDDRFIGFMLFVVLPLTVFAAVVGVPIILRLLG